MQQEENNGRSEIPYCDVTPEKFQGTPRNVGSARRSLMSQEIKRRIHCSPRGSPDNVPRTHPGSGFSNKDIQKFLSESNKRKIESSHNESLEKMQKTCPSGNFVNTLIEQWSKYMGIETPLSQSERTQECSTKHEMKHKQVIENQIIQRLKRKLQATEKALSSLSASHDTELRAREEILQQLNNDWESITKYYSEISENLKEFQKHKDNLSTLYNDVILAQQSTVKKLQQELSTMKLKDEEQRNILSTVENKIINAEKRIQEMVAVEIELKKHLENIKNEFVLEKNHLHNAHKEEKLELMKTQENLTSINQELQIQLKKVIDEKQISTNILAVKDEEIFKLQEELLVCKSKVENLLRQNTELIQKYEESIGKEEKLSKDLELKTEEISRLQENVAERLNIESSLATDLDIIGNNYKNLQNDLTNVEKKLKDAQIRNVNLEKCMQEAAINNDRKIVELNQKIILLEKENEQFLWENQSKMKEFEVSRRMLKEKYEAEITSLKKDFDTKLTEMKKSLTMQNSTFTKLNEALNKATGDNQNRKENYNPRIQEYRGELQENLKEKLQKIAELNVQDKAIECETQMNHLRAMNEQQFENQENMEKSTAKSKERSEVLATDDDVYCFTTLEINDDVQYVSDNVDKYSYLSQNKDIPRLTRKTEVRQKKEIEAKNDSTKKKKIFKTRNSGLRQYGTSKKMSQETSGKIHPK